jgi:deoxyribodipyrimidine photo-lyase
LRTRDHNETFVKEIAWREFWHHVRYNFPEFDHVEFQEKRRNIDWLNQKEDFETFCNAQT